MKIGMVPVYYFGQGCPHFQGFWGNDGYDDLTPDLVWCSHPDNPRDTEGNCNRRDCPLKKQE